MSMRWPNFTSKSTKFGALLMGLNNKKITNISVRALTLPWNLGHLASHGWSCHSQDSTSQIRDSSGRVATLALAELLVEAAADATDWWRADAAAAADVGACYRCSPVRHRWCTTRCWSSTCTTLYTSLTPQSVDISTMLRLCCCCCLWLYPRWRSDTLRISSFMDDVIFAHMLIGCSTSPPGWGSEAHMQPRSWHVGIPIAGSGRSRLLLAVRAY